MNKGYTLLEMLVVLMILSILLIVTSSTIQFGISESTENIIEDAAYLQHQAIMENETMEYDEEFYCRFNRIGNVNQANSFYVNDDWVIVSLGTGRLYVDE